MRLISLVGMKDFESILQDRSFRAFGVQINTIEQLCTALSLKSVDLFKENSLLETGQKVLTLDFGCKHDRSQLPSIL